MGKIRKGEIDEAELANLAIHQNNVVREIKITFDDWIFMQDEKVAINRATMSKFGIKVAELTVFFQKN